MTTRGYLPGRCSVCGGQAEQSSVTGLWWHLGPFYSQTSMPIPVPPHGLEHDGTGATKHPQFVAATP